jgi:hypothetical protein
VNGPVLQRTVLLAVTTCVPAWLTAEDWDSASKLQPAVIALDVDFAGDELVQTLGRLWTTSTMISRNCYLQVAKGH